MEVLKTTMNAVRKVARDFWSTSMDGVALSDATLLARLSLSKLLDSSESVSLGRDYAKVIVSRWEHCVVVVSANAVAAKEVSDSLKPKGHGRKTVPTRSVGRKELGIAEAEVQLAITECSDYLRRFQRLYQVLGLTGDVCEKDVKRFFNSALAGSLAKDMKEALVHLQAKWTGDRDYKPENGVGLRIFPRALRIKLATDLSSSRRHNPMPTWRINTVVSGLKRGLLPLRPSDVRKSLEGHMKTLSNEFPVSGNRMERLVKCAEAIMDGTKRKRVTVVNSVLEQISSKSTISYSYGDKGNVGAVQDMLLFGTLGEDLEYVNLYTYEFLGYDDTKREPTVLYGPYYEEDVRHFVRTYLESEGFEDFDSLVEPYFILEPLKVRTITKPAVLQYLGFRALQKTGHTWLKNHPSGAFAPIGSPFDADMRQRLLAAWRPGCVFVSGDYSQATNLLAGVVSERMHEVLYKPYGLSGDPLDKTVYERSKRSLTHSRIQYNNGYFVNQARACQDWVDDHPYEENPEEWRKMEALRLLNAFEASQVKAVTTEQKRGQLMGDPASFPLLCLWNAANLFDVWLSEVHGDEVEPTATLFMRCAKETGLLICGDDIAFISSPSLYRKWSYSVQRYGMELSPGKNFVSPNMVQFCNEMFILKRKSFLFSGVVCDQREFVGCDFFNLGWATCRKKQDCSRDISVAQSAAIFEAEDPLLQRLPALTKLWDLNVASAPCPVASTRVAEALWEEWRVYRYRFPKLNWTGLWKEGEDRYVLENQIRTMGRDLAPTKDFTVFGGYLGRLHVPEYEFYKRYPLACSKEQSLRDDYRAGAPVREFRAQCRADAVDESALGGWGVVGFELTLGIGRR